jgi:hypothetical protein
MPSMCVRCRADSAALAHMCQTCCNSHLLIVNNSLPSQPPGDCSELMRQAHARAKACLIAKPFDPLALEQAWRDYLKVRDQAIQVCGPHQELAQSADCNCWTSFMYPGFQVYDAYLRSRN